MAPSLGAAVAAGKGPVTASTPADRLAMALCKFGGACDAPCPWCRRLSAQHSAELATILRERHGGFSQVADWLDGIGAAPVTMATEP